MNNTLIHNACIYTLNDKQQTAEALYVEDGKIAAIGTNENILQKYGHAKTVIDAHQNCIYPGFIDAHCHLLRYAQMLGEVQLFGATSFEEIIERIEAYQQANPDKKVLLGRGWDQNLWPEKRFPDKTLLDKHFPNIPVLLTRVGLHAAVANQRALEMAGITLETQIEGGIIERKNGALTGLLIDAVVKYVEERLPKLTETELGELLIKAENNCFAVGLTSLGEALVMQSQVPLLRRLQEAKKMKMRLYCMILATPESKAYYWKKGIEIGDRLTIRTLKYFADGALGSRGAWLLAPYSDDANNFGLQLLESEAFVNDLKQCINNDFQVATHAIGDAANRFVLDAYGSVLADKKDHRWRVEHAQIVQVEDMKKFAQYQIVPSIQATHATSDMYWLVERLGSERVKLAYANQQLLQQNGVLAAGSDFPVEKINPLLGFYAAVTRQDAAGYPEEGFQMNNALSREEALKAMTIWAAYSQFEETTKGSLEVGKLADLVVLDRDIMKVDCTEILQTKVLKTFIGGEQVYENRALL